MTQAEFNRMLSTAVAQGIVGGTYVSQYDGEEIDGAIKRFSNKNLLDNWYFPAAINQRRETSWARNGYHIDRWHEVYPIAGSIDSNGWHLGASQCAIQYIPKEEMDLLIGKQATISILLGDGRFAFGSGVIGTGTVRASIPGVLNFEVAIFDRAKSYQTGRLSVKQDITVQAVKLELGNHQTLAHQDASGRWVLNDPPPNKALELAKCQRYQVELVSHFVSEYGDFGLGTLNVAKNGCFVIVVLPVPLRARPSIVSSGVFKLAQSGNSVANGVPVSSLSLDSMTNNSVCLRAHIENGSSLEYKIYSLWILPPSNGVKNSLILDANL